MTITVNSENLNKKRRIDLSKIGKVAREVFKDLKKKNGEVNIVFFSSQKMRGLNKRYTGRDNSTDVLAFPSDGDDPRFAGDIAICTDKAAKNARVYGSTFIEETALYVIHGILHLSGYDDTSERSRKVMRKKRNALQKRSKDFYSEGFVHSVNAALEGIVHALKSERNMRVHFLAGFLVLIAGIYFNLNFMEFMFLCFAVTFVLVAEMFNTAIEHAIDLVSRDYDPLAKISKDIAAGAVFVSSVNAVIVGYILIVKRAGERFGGIFLRIKQSPWHVTFITFLVVVGLVLAIKIIRREERLLRGGMPSGHSAVAFAVWVAVTMLTANALVSILVFLLALLIAKSRVGNGIHTLWEVIAGSVLGALISLLMFQILM